MTFRGSPHICRWILVALLLTIFTHFGRLRQIYSSCSILGTMAKLKLFLFRCTGMRSGGLVQGHWRRAPLSMPWLDYAPNCYHFLPPRNIFTSVNRSMFSYVIQVFEKISSCSEGWKKPWTRCFKKWLFPGFTNYRQRLTRLIISYNGVKWRYYGDRRWWHAFRSLPDFWGMCLWRYA